MGVLTTACLEISDEGSGIRNLEGDTERDLPGETERRGKEKNRLGLRVPEGEVVGKKTMVFGGIFMKFWRAISAMNRGCGFLKSTGLE